MKVHRNVAKPQEQQPFKECPRYQVCSCNECPLDYLMLSRIALPGEMTCRAQRKVREAIALKHPDLPTKGLTHAEIAGDSRRAAARARWAALPLEEQARRLRPQNHSALP